jgi:transcriptional regulator with XRE-family HTH domain
MVTSRHVASTVARLRRQLGWTQAELAARAGVTLARISQIETQSRRTLRMRVATVERFARVLGVDAAVLIEGRGEAPSGQARVLGILRPGRRLSCREVDREYGGRDAWRMLDALRRRGLVTCDRTVRPHRWSRTATRRVPGILERLAEVTAEIVMGSDGRRYLLVPLGADLREDERDS